MSDSTSWQPPVSPPAAPTSPWAPPAGYSAPPAGYGPPPGYGAQQGWTPPPKPGLIPLRPLTFGTLLGAAFQVLRRNPRPTFGFALLAMSATTLASMVLVGLVTVWAVMRINAATDADRDLIGTGSVLAIVLAALVPAALTIVIAALVQGVVSLEVARGTLGEKHRLRGLWRAARGRLGALVGWSAIVLAAVTIAILVLGALVAVLAIGFGAVGAVIGVVLMLLLGTGMLVLFAWLGTKLSLVPSVLMLERLSLRAAMARSWSLTDDFFWKTFGIQLLVAFIVQVAGSIVTTPLSLLLNFGVMLIDPNDTGAGAIVFLIATMLLTTAASMIVGALALVIQSATPALIYIDIRMRKEGLDLELQRFVEARQAGDSTVGDPYLRLTTLPTTPGGSAWA